MTMGLMVALGLVAAILLAVYWGRNAGIDAARASDLESIRGKNAEINEEFSKMRKEQGKDLDAIDSADAASQLRFIGRRRGKNS